MSRLPLAAPKHQCSKGDGDAARHIHLTASQSAVAGSVSAVHPFLPAAREARAKGSGYVDGVSCAVGG